MMNITRTLRTAAAVSLITAAGCLDVAEPAPLVPIEQTNFAASLGVNLSASTKTTNGAYYRDIVVGSGAVVAQGQTLSVRYTGWLANGTQFDSNVNQSTPYSFRLGLRDVIDGWDETLVGTRVGGKRQLIIPPSLGYGPYGYGPIPPNSVLVFTVEVIAAQ